MSFSMDFRDFPDMSGHMQPALFQMTPFGGQLFQPGYLASTAAEPQRLHRRTRRRKEKRPPPPPPAIGRIHFVQKFMDAQESLPPQPAPTPLPPPAPNGGPHGTRPLAPAWNVLMFRKHEASAGEVPSLLSEASGVRADMEHTFWVNATGSMRCATLPDPFEEAEEQHMGDDHDADVADGPSEEVAPGSAQPSAGADTQNEHPDASLPMDGDLGQARLWRKRKASLSVPTDTECGYSASGSSPYDRRDEEARKKRRCTHQEPLSPSTSHSSNIDVDHPAMLLSNDGGSALDAPFKDDLPQKWSGMSVDSAQSAAEATHNQDASLPVETVSWSQLLLIPPGNENKLANSTEDESINMQDVEDAAVNQEGLLNGDGEDSEGNCPHQDQNSSEDNNVVDMTELEAPSTHLLPENSPDAHQFYPSFPDCPSDPHPETPPQYMHGVNPYAFVPVPFYSGQPGLHPYGHPYLAFPSPPGSAAQSHAAVPGFFPYAFPPVPTAGPMPPLMHAPLQVPVPLPVPVPVPNGVPPSHPWPGMCNMQQPARPHPADFGFVISPDGGLALAGQLDGPKLKGRGRDKGPHQCPLCLRLFRYPNGLALHLKWHWGASRLDWRQGVSQSGFANARARGERSLAEAQARVQQEHAGVSDAAADVDASTLCAFPTPVATPEVLPGYPVADVPLELPALVDSAITVTPPRESATPAQTSSSSFFAPVVALATPHAGFSLRIFTSRISASPETVKINPSARSSAPHQGSASLLPPLFPKEGPSFESHFPRRPRTQSVLQTPERRRAPSGSNDAASAVRSSPYDDLFGSDYFDDESPDALVKEMDEDQAHDHDNAESLQPVAAASHIGSSTSDEGSRPLSPLVQFAALQLLP